MDEEHNVDDAVARLSAFLVHYESFRYIEARSGMEMSDNGLVFTSALPSAFFAKGTPEPGPELAPLQRLSNRERHLLEPPLTHRKQTVAPRSNRELSTNQRSCNSHALMPLYTAFDGSLRSLALASHSSLATRHSPISNRFCTTNRNRRNLLKTNDEKISNRGQNTH